MQSQNRIFEDMSKIATSAMGTMAGVGREVETLIRARIRELVGDVDMVGRDEFEAVKAMAARAREDAEALKAEVAALKAAAVRPSPGDPVVDAAPPAAATEDGTVPDEGTGSAPIV